MLRDQLSSTFNINGTVTNVSRLLQSASTSVASATSTDGKRFFGHVFRVVFLTVHRINSLDLYQQQAGQNRTNVRLSMGLIFFNEPDC